MENGVSWYLRFEPDPQVRSVDLEHRHAATRAYFQACLARITPLPEGVRLLNANDLMLSVSLEGPEDQCRKLAQRVEMEAIGQMIRNARVGIAAAIQHAD